MEIKIDTKKDSVEDIKKVIGFLQKFIDENTGYESMPEADEGMFNIFNDEEESSSSEFTNPFDDDSGSDVFGNSFSKEEDDDEDGDVHIVPY